MKRIQRLSVLIGCGIFASFLAISLANYFIGIYSITDIASKATIVGGILTLLGTIFSAVYKEFSSYYTARSENASKKWDLILPFIKTHYNAWINSALSLADTVKRIKDNNTVTDDQATRMLYLTAVFYGVRLRFVLNDGGLILLSTPEEEKKVNDAYREIIDSFQWFGTSTPNKVSELQKLFVEKNKPETPYVLTVFEKDVVSNTSLQTSRDTMKTWISNIDNRKNLFEKLNNFAEIFKISINKLYTDWE